MALFRICKIVLFVAFALFTLAHVFGDDSLQDSPVTADVLGKLVLPSQMTSEKFKGFKIILNGGERITYSRDDNTFEFRNLPAGGYLMTVFHPFWSFPTYRLHVSKKDGSVQATSHEGKWEPQDVVQTRVKPLTLTSIGNPAYFHERKELSILSMFMNPMGLMMGVTMLMVFCMPRMMDSIDPEELKRIQEEQRKQQQDMDPSKMLNGAMAQFLGVSKPEEDSDDDSD